MYSNTLPGHRILVAIKQNDKIHLFDRKALPEVTKRLEVLIKKQEEGFNNLKKENDLRESQVGESLKLIKKPRR